MSVRTSFAASTFAGLSRLGVSEDNKEITLRSCKTISKSGQSETRGTTYDRFDGVHWQPPLPSVLVSILILTGCVLRKVLEQKASATKGHGNLPE